MKTDQQLKSDVTAELACDPAINYAHVGVMVKDGVVTLAGHLDSFFEKHAVEKAVRRVAGVKGIALDLEIKLPPGRERDDSDIALAATTALHLNSPVPEGKVQVQVENGWVTLTGEVAWAYQAASAEQCIRPLAGVRGLSNQIRVKPHVQATDVAAQIKAALIRHAAREARNIGIEVDGSVVTLTGKVDTLAEHDAATGVALSSRGVSRVVDHLQVGA